MATCVWTRQVFGNPTSREFAPGRIALDAAGGVVGVMEWRAIWIACAATSVMTTGILQCGLWSPTLAYLGICFPFKLALMIRHEVSVITSFRILTLTISTLYAPLYSTYLTIFVYLQIRAHSSKLPVLHSLQFIFPPVTSPASFFSFTPLQQTFRIIIRIRILSYHL